MMMHILETSARESHTVPKVAGGVGGVVEQTRGVRGRRSKMGVSGQKRERTRDPDAWPTTGG
eukprot:CAMPEP_0113532428 /NCGR_PEP_ID=MMETSP0015_2-20120614/4054_1 /TAXON_ID=2838 /ORGANISM="Odontella" /LENGTH=61 /DNA_ID=CAMNT_0000431389 /DNA_START=722 /DNA_END=904 /DNA_ORIENTATION=+ /assembly_acc=CAM_ASM_000160